MADNRIQAPWLQAPFVRKVIAAVGADHIRFVGGAVRDTLIGREIGDIDAATSLAPAETMAALKAAGIRAVPTGLDHGTVTAVEAGVEDGQHIEITTLRVDVETDGRHADVAFTADWREDAARRDFTMNALYLSADGTLFDPFDGLADLQAGHVRFIGDAETRIREDALRILRFFRFYARFGKGEIDAEGLAACRALASMIDGLSAERVRDEMLKLLAAADPVPAWRAMMAAGVAGHLPGQGQDTAALDRVIAREHRFGLMPDVFIRLSAVTGLTPDAVKPLARALRLSGKQQRHLREVAAGCAAMAVMSEKALRAFVYREGKSAGLAHLMTVAEEPPQALLHWVTDWTVPVLPVRGADLIAAGVPEGPQISATLAGIEAAWVASDFRSARAELLRQVKP